MRKVGAYSLAWVYAFLATGFMVNIHFCCGGIADISIWQELAPCCCTHSDEGCSDDEGCCDYQTFDIGIDEEHQMPLAVDAPAYVPMLEAAPLILFSEDFVSSHSNALEINRGPPDGVPLFIRDCSLILYG